jgi:hypothetical protein
LDNAIAVTQTGQFVIQQIQKKINIFFNKLYGTEKEDFVIYSDTDSTTGDTIIDVNGKNITIEEFYNSYSSEILEYGENKFVKKVIDTYTKTFENDLIISKPIEYVMKHSIEKEMFQIFVDGKSVIITEDHGLMIERDGQIIPVKPKNVLPQDKLIYKYIQTPIETSELCLKN